MSELQMALIGFGVLLVVAVWAYNIWQERKHRQRAERILPSADTDVLMAGKAVEGERSEPGFAAPAPAVPPEPTFSAPGEDDTGGRDDPDAVSPEEAEAVLAQRPLPAEWADGRADCLLRIEFVDAVPANELWAAHADWSATIDKPLQWLGLDEKSGRWRILLPHDAGNVTQLAVALQLADRKGPVSEATLTAFLGGAHQLAQRFAGLVELPSPTTVLALARELDAFCAGVDLQLTLHVVPREGSLNEMLGARLKPLLDAAALRLEGERFVAVDADGVEVYAVSGQSAAGFSAARLESQGLSALSFSIDVPRVVDGPAGFDRMLGFARQCAETLGGQLADPHQKPLADATIAAIRARIGDLQAQMAAHGIAAGSVRALRLFS